MTEIPSQTEIVEEAHKHNFIPLWMPVGAFVLIVLAYLYCLATGIQVNEYRAIGAIGISGIFAAVSVYLNYK